MALEVFANNYATTLNGSITSTATSVVVNDTPPTALSVASTQWRLLIESELVLVTAVSSKTLTITRGIEGTTASSHGNAAVATHVLTAGALAKAYVEPRVCEGRLSLSSTLAVPVTDISNAGTIYFQPFRGNRIALYDGSKWVYCQIDSGGSAASASVSAASGAVQDVFAAINGNGVTLSFVTWTNATTRATALGTQDGVLVLSTDSTKRYLGTIYANASISVSDTFALRGVWNYYNRVRRKLLRQEATASWTYASTTWRQANGSASNQVAAVVGVVESPIELDLRVQASILSDAAVDISEDSTSTSSSTDVKGAGAAASSGLAQLNTICHAKWSRLPVAGYHFYAWIEQAPLGSSTTFFGSGGSSQSGLVGYVEG